MSELNDKERIDAAQNAFIEKLNQVLDFIPGYRGYRKGVENVVGMAQGKPNRYSVGEYIRDLGYSVVPFYGAYDNAISDRPQDWKTNALEAVLIGLPMKGKYGKYEVDVPKTKAMNEKLLNKANELKAQGDYYFPSSLERLAKEEPMSYDTYRDLRGNFDYYKPLDEEWRNIIISDATEPKVTRYSTDIMPEHKLYSNTSFGAINPSTARTLNLPMQYPTGYDVDFLTKRYNDKNVRTYLPEPGFKDYSFTAGEFEDALRERSNAARLYRDDFDSPYAYMGQYDYKVRGLKGLDQEQRQALMERAREYEQVLLDQTLDEATKRARLNALKQEIDLLETIGSIK